MTPQELKPCPFCGGEAKIKQEAKNSLRLACTQCGMGIKQRVVKLSLEWLEKTMITQWNKRV